MCLVLSCLVPSRPTVPSRPVPSHPVPSRPTVLSCPVLSCPVLPSLVASYLVFSLRGSFCCCFVHFFYNQIKAHSPGQLSHRLIHSPQPRHQRLLTGFVLKLLVWPSRWAFIYVRHHVKTINSYFVEWNSRFEIIDWINDSLTKKLSCWHLLANVASF